MIKRLTAALILIFVIISTLSSCKSENADDTNTTNANENPTDANQQNPQETTADDRKSISDGLEARDYGGKEFVIATRDDANGLPCRHILEVYAEADAGEVLSDAVYKRNMMIEERFNCKIVPKYMDEKDESALTRELQNTVRAGDFFADVAIGHMVFMSAAALQNLFYNWYDVPNIDFEKPWWNETATKELQVAGKSFFAFSDMLITGYDSTYAIAFNKKLLSDFGLENPYNIVNEGKWTIDKLHELTKDIYVDINGNGTVDMVDDTFGFVSNAYSAAAAWPWAFNQFITQRDADGYPEIILNNEKSAQITAKMYDYFYNTPGWSIMTEGQRDTKMWWDYVRSELFPEDKALFGTIVLGDTLIFRAMESDFGILPMPKWNEEQDKYYTMIDGHGPLMSIPTTAADNAEMIGTIMEALSAESYKQVLPAYYDISLKNKQLRDEESIQMLDDYIRTGVLFDFGFIYDGSSGFAFWLSNILQPKKSEFASYYESKETAVQKYYDKVIAAHDNYVS